MDPETVKPLNGREKAKEARRQLIIQAAGSLIRESASTSFSMHDLAKRAGFSTYTTYNLIGSKATVFYILLNQCIDRIDTARILSEAKGDPLDCVLQSGNASVDLFVSDPDFYRPLMRFVFGVLDPVHRPAFMDRSYRYWLAAIAPLIEGGHIGTEFMPVDLARDLLVFFTGALEFWVHGELDSNEFRAQIRHGLAMRLMTLDIKDSRERLLREVQRVRPVIESFCPKD